MSAFEAHPTAKMVRCGMIVSDDTTNLSHATPECVLRRSSVTSTWPSGPNQDQTHFTRIVDARGWTAANGDVVVLDEPPCRANWDQQRGLRAGAH